MTRNFARTLGATAVIVMLGGCASTDTPQTATHVSSMSTVGYDHGTPNLWAPGSAPAAADSPVQAGTAVTETSEPAPATTEEATTAMAEPTTVTETTTETVTTPVAPEPASAEVTTTTTEPAPPVEETARPMTRKD